MASITSWLFAPFAWMTSSPNEQAGFAQNVCNDIAQFEQQLTTAFQDVDITLQGKTVFVDYTYQAIMGDLRAKYMFTLQPNDWPQNVSPYNRIYLFKPLCKDLDYVSLDEQTHAKIDTFIANNIGLFHPTPPTEPGNYAGFRFEDCPGSKNLRKINIVAVNYFEYTSKQENPAAKIAAEIKRFEDMVKALSDDLNQIISGKKTIEVAVKTLPNVPRRKDLLKTKAPSAKGVTENSTNLQASDLMAKQAAFNPLFTAATGNYTRRYQFEMDDGGLQFNVIYNWQASDYIARRALVFYTFFNVTKKFQEDQRQFCEAQSSKVVPNGELDLIQNEVSYFQYMARSPWPTNLTQDQIQDNLGTFSTNSLNVI